MVNAEHEIILDLRGLSERSSKSVRWHRPYLKPDHPDFLPHFRTGGKVYVLWSEYLEWFERFRVQGNFREKVNDIVIELRSKDELRQQSHK
jgi:hypothetical protein